MALRLTVAEIVIVFTRREKITIRALAKELGYVPSTFYTKMYKNRWKVEDLQKLKERFDVTMDDILMMI